MEMVYMNNAATSWPKAPGVAEMVARKLVEIPHHAGRAGFSAPDHAGDCRKQLADLLKISDHNRIVFCQNATHALNVAFHGFPWRPDATVITTVAEHNSILRPLHYLLQHQCIRRVEFVPVDNQGRIIPEVLEDAIRKFSPQMVAFTHASNVTGSVNNAKLLCDLAKKAGAATLLDASQTLGFTEVLPEAWGADLVAFTGHKYLLGPPGTGGLYIAPATILEPVWVGGTGVKSELDTMPEEMPIRFEAGTPNDPAFAGLGQALTWLQENPFDRTALLAKVERLAGGLAQAGAAVIDVSPDRTPVIAFTVPGWEVEDVGEILQKSFGIICRTGLHCAPRILTQLGLSPRGSIRLSLSRFTTDAEVDYCIAAVKDIVQS